MKKIPALYLLSVALILLFWTSCNEEPPVDDDNAAKGLNNIENTLGYSLLNKVKGIWNGAVTSTTALGGYPEFIIDFRPISAAQISSKNELDSLNDIHISFFIAKKDDQYRLCFRNGGGFAGLQRISYFLADSVSETSSESFYHFAEVVKGTPRAYTDFLFKGDSLIMTSYTNNYNSQTTATMHMQWRATLQDSTSCQAAVSNFSFPQKVLVKDFSSTFDNVAEAIYYDLASDPYPENQQPYLGQATISYSFSGGFVPDPSKKVFIMITTQPLISGFTVNTANMIYRSRYVILSADDNSFVFNYMHPGSYYLYALYDTDGNMTFSSGDRVSTVNTAFSLSEEGTVSSSASINFVIP